MRRNFSLVARYSLKFTRCSLLVVKSLVARCKFCSLLVVEVARCKKSLATCCRSHSLQKITRYSLQKFCSLLVAKMHSLLIAKYALYSLQKLLVVKNHSLLVAKFTRYSLQTLLVAKNHSLLFAKIHSLLVAKFAHYSLQKLLVPKNHWFLVAKIPSIHIAKNHFSLKQSPAGIIVCLKSTKVDESFSSYFRFSYLNSRTSTKRRIQVNLHTCLVLV